MKPQIHSVPPDHPSAGGAGGIAPLCVAVSAAIGVVLATLSTALPARAEPSHGIAMYGAPALPADFDRLPYVRPDAPKGGRIVFGESGGFDSLNPWILKGRAPWGMGQHVVETLMMRSIDEPFTLYCLLCETVETAPDRSWVEFTLRPEAHFSDGRPVTVEDVIWSFTELGTNGHPRYRGAWAKVKEVASPGPDRVRITFNEPDRELPLLMGLRPVLEKAQWQGRDFTESGLTVPVGSGPYVVADFEPGRFISFRKDPDWWGKDLAVNVGRQNLDEIRYEFFSDSGVSFQAFRSGSVDVWREINSARWATQFDFPAVRSGDVVLEEIAHRRPSGITGLVFNTRLPQFADWRVREALTLAFNYPFINKTVNLRGEPRITSFFANSELAFRPGPAEGAVADLLAPFAADLPPGTIEGAPLPAGDADNLLPRADLRRAVQLLADAGWQVTAGQLADARGRRFDFEILLPQGNEEARQVVDIYLKSLARLGIAPRVTTVDSAQFVQRTNDYDFGMTWYLRALSLSPGNEQMLYWGHEGVTQPGSRNWMGMNSPAAEAMIARMVSTGDPDDFRAAVRALDRILTEGRWVIPVWFSPADRIAHAAALHHPENLPLYGDWPGFLPDVWWRDRD